MIFNGATVGWGDLEPCDIPVNDFGEELNGMRGLMVVAFGAVGREEVVFDELDLEGCCFGRSTKAIGVPRRTGGD